MRLRRALCLVVLLSSRLVAQAPPTRNVSAGTLTSKADPAAVFVVDNTFRYAGGQTIDILKVAGAEQYFFIEAAPDHSVQRFYWLQFEHYYPTNSDTYDYSGIKQQPVPLGRLRFMGDVRTSRNFFTMDDRPGSDSKAAELFLRARGFTLSGTFVSLRLFYLPDSTKRRELMIIYGERLADSAADTLLTTAITSHAQAGLTIH
jgi:hypothetical protein